QAEQFFEQPGHVGAGWRRSERQADGREVDLEPEPCGQPPSLSYRIEVAMWRPCGYQRSHDSSEVAHATEVDVGGNPAGAGDRGAMRVQEGGLAVAAWRGQPDRGLLTGRDPEMPQLVLAVDHAMWRDRTEVFERIIRRHGRHPTKR